MAIKQTTSGKTEICSALCTLQSIKPISEQVVLPRTSTPLKHLRHPPLQTKPDTEYFTVALSVYNYKYWFDVSTATNFDAGDTVACFYDEYSL